MKISKEHTERWKDQDIRFQPIGIIHSEHTEQENTPIQGIFNSCKGCVDILDGTPLLDIKPYVKQFDSREDVKSGRLDNQHVERIAEWESTPKELRKRK